MVSKIIVLFEDKSDHHSLAAEIAWLQHGEACNSSVEREETKTNRRRSKGIIPVRFRSSGSRWWATLYRQYKHLPILDPCLGTPGIRPSQYCGTLSFVPPLAVKRKTCQLPSPVYHRSVWKSSTAGGHLACPKVKATKTCFRPSGTHHWQACGPVQRFRPTN